MLNRKKFIQQSALATLSAGVLALQGCKDEKPKGFHPENIKDENAFWKYVREQYFISDEIINLNNGAVSPQPMPVQQAHIENYQFANRGPSYFMWRKLDEQREPLRNRVAEFCGVSVDEIAFNRNTTEGLNTIIFGLNLKAGDEVVLCKFDYPNMMNAWKQREKRDGIKLNWVELNFPEEDDAAIVAKYVAAITPKTKIVHITHLINWTGQILPVRKIADAAKAKGCEVIVDASHSFAHLDYKISDLNCDYYAASFHKWLCAPFGTGFMFIKKEKIKNVWALLSSNEPDGDNIRKFESLGTRSFAAEMAVHAALDFHQKIGNQRKENRLRFLKNYWCEKVKDLKGVSFYTSLKDEYSCCLATFAIEGMKAEDIATKLFINQKIHATTVLHEGLNGVRISPNVYTSTDELDILVYGIKSLV
jgi:selenocysteine lyase/cysteine desulfurase